MPTGAKYFQHVLDIVKKWSVDGMLSKLVHGQLAIEDIDRRFVVVPYITVYASRPEWQMRGAIHHHCLIWEVRDD